MSDTDELTQISKMHVDLQSKNWLRENLLARVGTMQHIKAIDACIAHERASGNIAGLLDLLELRLEVMLDCPLPRPFSDVDHMRIADQIHNLAIDQNNATKEATQGQRTAQPTQANTTVLVEERLRFRPGRRASRHRRNW